MGTMESSQPKSRSVAELGVSPRTRIEVAATRRRSTKIPWKIIAEYRLQQEIRLGYGYLRK
jgi:hypothetical protein